MMVADIQRLLMLAQIDQPPVVMITNVGTIGPVTLRLPHMMRQAGFLYVAISCPKHHKHYVECAAVPSGHMPYIRSVRVLTCIKHQPIETGCVAPRLAEMERLGLMPDELTGMAALELPYPWAFRQT